MALCCRDRKITMAEIKTPQIEDLTKITPESFLEYVEFVAQMRHNQRRYFNTRKPDALELSKQMEKELDKLNEKLLDKQLKLF